VSRKVFRNFLSFTREFAAMKLKKRFKDVDSKSVTQLVKGKSFKFFALNLLDLTTLRYIIN